MSLRNYFDAYSGYKAKLNGSISSVGKLSDTGKAGRRPISRFYANSGLLRSEAMDSGPNRRDLDGNVAAGREIQGQLRLGSDPGCGRVRLGEREKAARDNQRFCGGLTFCVL